jgi:hypothetical protein
MNLARCAEIWVKLCWLIDVNAACAGPEHVEKAMWVSNEWKKSLYGEDGNLWN